MLSVFLGSQYNIIQRLYLNTIIVKATTRLWGRDQPFMSEELILNPIKTICGS